MNLVKLTKVILPAVILLFSACVDTLNDNQSEQAGPADDGEVIKEIGGVATSGISRADELSLAISSLSNVPEISGRAPISSGGGAPLAKSAADAGEVTEVIDDTKKDKGEVLVVKTTKALLYTLTESVWIKWDDKAQDDVEGNENIIRFKSAKKFVSGRVELADVKDLDGDGIVGGDPQYTNKAQAYFTVTNIFGVIEETNISMTCGADKDFDTEDDNLILALSWKKTDKNGRKLGNAEFADADGDNILLDRTKSDPSVVDLVLYEAGNIFKPLVEYSQLEMRIEVTDEVGDGKIIRISGEEKFKNGRLNRIRAANSKGEETIRENDTVNITITSDFPVTDDSLLSSEILFVVDVGSGLQDSTDNLVHEIHVTHEKRFGIVKNAEFHFVAKDPVPNGENPKNGKVDIKVEFRNGKTWTLTGTFDEGKLDATITGPEGKTLTVKWDENGEPL